MRILRVVGLGLALIGLMLAVVAGGCEGTDKRVASGDGDTDVDTDGDTDADGDSDGDADGDADGLGCEMMDILFVIDDSGSMGCEQDYLATTFPEFIQVVEDFNNENADEIEYRIGVTSTGRTVNYTIDVLGTLFPFNENGMNGELVEEAGQRWIDGPGNQSEIVSWFSAAASLGTGGPSYEMPLHGMGLAIAKDAEGETNEGFFRDNSLAIVVIITDEDDCSTYANDFTITSDNCMGPPQHDFLEPLQTYKDFLDEKFGGEDKYVVVTIAGLDGCGADAYPTTCDEDDSYAGALDAERLVDFMDNYIGTEEGGSGVFADICTMSMSEALDEALQKMEVACDEFPIE